MVGIHDDKGRLIYAGMGFSSVNAENCCYECCSLCICCCSGCCSVWANCLAGLIKCCASGVTHIREKMTPSQTEEDTGLFNYANPFFLLTSKSDGETNATELDVFEHDDSLTTQEETDTDLDSITIEH